MRTLSLALLFSLPCFASLPNTLNWDVRTGGASTNGGGFDPSVASPGTDYSQQNSAQIAYTDLVIGATTTQYTSALDPVGATIVGNTIQIVGGSGCSTGFYNVRSQAAAVATVDRSMGSAASTCTANLGGSLDTWAHAASAAFSSGNTIWVHSGSYTAVTSSIAVCNNLNYNYGYNSAHGDNPLPGSGNQPLLTTATSSVDTVEPGGPCVIAYMHITVTAASSPFSAISDSGTNSPQFYYFNDLASGGDAVYDTNGVTFFEMIGNRLTGTGVGLYFGNGNSNNLVVRNNYFANTGTACLWDGNQNNDANSWDIEYNTFGGCSYGVYHQNGSNIHMLQVIGNNFYGSTHDGLNIQASMTTGPVTIYNNVFFGNGGKNINLLAVPSYLSFNPGNAFDAAGNTNWVAGVADVTLTANPWVAVATPNFALNTTSGGGAAVKAAGYPGVTPAGTGYAAMGALQPQSSGGAAPHAIVQ